MNALRSTFGGKLAMKVEEVISKIQDQYPSLAKGSDELQELLRYLSVMGMVSNHGCTVNMSFSFVTSTCFCDSYLFDVFP